MRRIRTLRRKVVRPRLRGLGRRIAVQVTEPVRLPVARQLRRLAVSLDASVRAASRMATAEELLGVELRRVQEQVGTAARAVSGQGARSRPAVPGSLPVALALALATLALVAGNSWLLERFLIPPVLESGALPMLVVSGPWLAIPFSVLALVLGLFHFALFTSGRSTLLRLVAVVAVLLLIAQGGLQGAATVVAVQAWTGAATASWPGLVALALLAGAAGLVPPVIGAAAHAFMHRISRWSAAREQRSARRTALARERLAVRIERVIRDLSLGMAMLRAESAAVGEGDVARLLLRPSPPPAVGHLAQILEDMSLAVRQDRAGWSPGPGSLVLRYLTDLVVLAVWVVVAVAAMAMTAPALTGVAPAIPGLATPPVPGSAAPAVLGLAVLATVVVLLLAGLILRLILSRSGRATDPRISGAAILVGALGIASLAMAIGSAAVAVDPGRDPLQTAAILNVLILVAAVASARLPEAVHSTAAMIRVAGHAVAWLVLAVLDRVLALVDLALTGRRRWRPYQRRPRRRHASPAASSASPALGMGPGRR